MDLININNLAVDCIIGINPSERTRTQPLLISAKLGVDLAHCAYTRHLKDTVNYADVCNDLRELAIKMKAELLEVLADKMCELIFIKHKKVSSIELTLLKPQAVVDAQSVGISIERTRQYYLNADLDCVDLTGMPPMCVAELPPNTLRFSLFRTCFKNSRRQWCEDLGQRKGSKRNADMSEYVEAKLES